MNNHIPNNPFHPLNPMNAAQAAALAGAGQAQNGVVNAAAALAQQLPANQHDPLAAMLAQLAPINVGAQQQVEGMQAVPEHFVADMPLEPVAPAAPQNEEEPGTPVGQGIPQVAPGAPLAAHHGIAPANPFFQGINLLNAFNALWVDAPNTPDIQDRK